MPSCDVGHASPLTFCKRAAGCRASGQPKESAAPRPSHQGLDEPISDLIMQAACLQQVAKEASAARKTTTAAVCRGMLTPCRLTARAQKMQALLSRSSDSLQQHPLVHPATNGTRKAVGIRSCQQLLSWIRRIEPSAAPLEFIVSSSSDSPA